MKFTRLLTYCYGDAFRFNSSVCRALAEGKGGRLSCPGLFMRAIVAAFG